VGIERLQQLADDFTSFPPDEYPNLVLECRELAINLLDVRYMIVGECFQLSSNFFGDIEDGFVTLTFFEDLKHAWSAYLPGILAADEETGTALALALQEELRALGQTGPRLDTDEG
jgi:hypothetical protein